jgi:hypothetical protein
VPDDLGTFFLAEEKRAHRTRFYQDLCQATVTTVGIATGAGLVAAIRSARPCTAPSATKDCATGDRAHRKDWVYFPALFAGKYTQ